MLYGNVYLLAPCARCSDDQHCSPKNSPDGWFMLYKQVFKHQCLSTNNTGVVTKTEWSSLQGCPCWPRAQCEGPQAVTSTQSGWLQLLSLDVCLGAHCPSLPGCPCSTWEPVFLVPMTHTVSSDRWAQGNLKEPEFCRATHQAKLTAIMVRMTRLDAPPLLTQSFVVIRPSAWGKGTSSHWVSLSLLRVGKLWMEIPHGDWKLLPKSPTSEEPRRVYIQAGFNLLPVFGQVGGGTWESPDRSQSWGGPWLGVAPFWVNSAGSGTDAHSCMKGAAGGIMAAVCARVQTVPHRPGPEKQWGNKQPSEQCTHFLSSHWAEWGLVGWFHLTKSHHLSSPLFIRHDRHTDKEEKWQAFGMFLFSPLQSKI